ncbi:hypothetical protein [Azospirillum palustre]
MRSFAKYFFCWSLKFMKSYTEYIERIANPSSGREVTFDYSAKAVAQGL